MCVKPSVRGPEALGRITVDAPERASVVHADVAAHGAAAEFPLTRIFSERGRYAEQTVNELAVHAGAGHDAGPFERKAFGTRDDRDAVFIGGSAQRGKELHRLVIVGIGTAVSNSMKKKG